MSPRRLMVPHPPRRVRVRKRPCPYCGKRLIATTKGKWRRNLAQHHAHCEPGKAHWRQLALQEVPFILSTMMAILGVPPMPLKVQAECAKDARDVSELERLYQLEQPK